MGDSSDIVFCVAQHKAKVDKKSFTARYNLDKLVYYEAFQMTGDAIGREKQIKGCSRAYKETLINSSNSEWLDLYEEVKNFYGHCEEQS